MAEAQAGAVAPLTDLARTTAMSEWYTVTFRGPAEMTVWVQADSAADAKAKADDGDYDDATQVEFLRGRRYTMKAKADREYDPERSNPW